LDVGRVHLHSEQRAAGIGDNVTLAALHSLACIKPAWAATFRRFHTLAVDDPSRRSALASRRSAGALHQHTIDPPPDVAVAPTIKIVLDRCERRKIFRQGAPLAAGGKNIENRIDDDAKVPLRRAPDVTPLRQQSAQQHPLFPRRIACIAQPVAAILSAGGFGPSHVVLPSSIRKHEGITTRAKITCFLFGQPLRMRADRAPRRAPGLFWSLFLSRPASL